MTRKPTSRRLGEIGFAALIGLFLASTAFGAEAPTETSDQAAELAKKLQNPVAALISVPIQSNFEWGAGAKSEGFRYLLNVQPVIPISISESWNIISRTIIPIIHQTDTIGPTTQDGIADIVQSLFLSPKAPGPGGFIWAPVPSSSFRPRATSCSDRRSLVSVRRRSSSGRRAAGRTARWPTTSGPSPVTLTAFM